MAKAEGCGEGGPWICRISTGPEQSRGHSSPSWKLLGEGPAEQSRVPHLGQVLSPSCAWTNRQQCCGLGPKGEEGPRPAPRDIALCYLEF